MAADLDYYELSADDAIKKLQSSEKGLSSEEAKVRLEQYGLNKIKEKKKRTALIIFLSQFKSWLIAILIVAAIISAAIKFWVDAAVILSIVVLNAILGFVQEYKAERAVEKLMALAAPKATVLRDGEPTVISSLELVPGDIVLLETGDKISADLRLMEAINFKIDEAALTGESVPVDKLTDAIKKKSVVAERKNCAFMNTIVVHGRAKGVVFATGMATEIGKIAHLIQTAEEKATPLQKNLADVGAKLGWAIVGICAVIFGIGLFRGGEILQMFLTAISLAVAAVPEGLPAVVTITLAIGVNRLAKTNSIIRKLPAVETLGSCSFICCDKTGTLTKNEMTVKKVLIDNKIVDIGGEGYAPVGEFLMLGRRFDTKDEHMLMALKIGTLCNGASLHQEREGWKITGDPTEGALIVLSAKAGLTKENLLNLYPLVSELSFDSIRKRMTTIHKGPHGHWAFTKGAPDLLLKQCGYVFEGGKISKLTERKRAEILKANEQFASSALRVLGLAFRELKELPKKAKHEEIEQNLVFVGLVGMIDPPRPEVKAALQTCESAGIKVSMVTGDHKTTATAIGRELGLVKEHARIIDGEELDGLSDKELEMICENVAIYARVTPEHKMRIVSALQKRGHFVAMTGDGVNDAPALKDANIGIAMGITGTDVAKEASAMILEDDNFATIVKAVREGRNVYDNIKKFVNYLLTSNAGEITVIFAASLGGLPLPLIAVQILWMNLLTDGLPAVALGADPPEPETMQRPPRKPGATIIDKSMIEAIILTAALMTVFTLGLFWLALQRGADMAQARTIALATLVVFQMARVQAVRAEHKTPLLANKWLLIALAISVALLLAIIYIPVLGTLFGTAPLGLRDWAFIATAAVFGFVFLTGYGRLKWAKKHQ